MTVETVTHTIQLILAPVVMLTACGLLLNSLVVRYGAIAEHLRALSRERLDMLRGARDTTLDRERLTEIKTQVPELLRRHKHLHDALLLVYASVLVFIGSMFVIAVATAANSALLTNVVLVMFLFGVGLLFAGVLVVMVEVRNSHRVSQFEALRGGRL